MKPQECYIGQILVKYKKLFDHTMTREEYLKIKDLIESGNMSGTIGEKGWWIVKKEFRLNEWSG